MKILALILSVALQAASASMTFDKTVHDFGKIALKDGPVSCTFKLTNNTDTVQYIQAVVTSCGCTKSEWTRTGIEPGASGTVEVTFTNDEGAHPFDKTVSVYTSAGKKPTVLHLRGVVKKK